MPNAMMTAEARSVFDGPIIVEAQPMPIKPNEWMNW